MNGRTLTNDQRREQVEVMAENCRWLLKNGVHPVWWPKRVGAVSLGALEKRLRERGHRDVSVPLLRELNAYGNH